MRGGWVARLGLRSFQSSRDLDACIAAMRWHGGDAQTVQMGNFEARLLVADEDGPFVEERDGITVVHGDSILNLTALKAASYRFSHIQSDGTAMQISRDALGLAAVFYRFHDSALWLSNEIACLLQLGRPQPDFEALVAQAADTRMSWRTGWSGVFRLLPGTTMTIESDGLTPGFERWWRPEDYIARFRGPRDEAAAQFRANFLRALRLCGRDEPAVMFSGGMDSSAVAVGAHRAGIKTALYHAVFPGMPGTSEMRFAQAVAAAVGEELVQVEGNLSPWDPLAEIERYSLPLENMPIGVYDAVLASAAAHGDTAILDGHDGDGIFSFPPQALRGQLLLHGRLLGLAALARREGWETCLRGVAANLLPPGLRFRKLRGRPAQELLSIFGYFFEGPAMPRLRAKTRWQFAPEAWRTGELNIVLPPMTVQYEEWEMLAASYGLDIRHPLAEPRLVRDLLALPFNVKSDAVVDRTILREALRDVLPGALVERNDKSYFDSVLRARLSVDDCMMLIDDCGVRLPGVNYRRLRETAEDDPEFLYDNPAIIVGMMRVHAFAAAA